MPIDLAPRFGNSVRKVARRTLIGVSLFHALSAVGGGIGMVVADGLSMPKSLLANSPFSTFFLPGVILAVVVGGTQTLALVRLLQHAASALLWSAVAGFGMVIWIIAEIGFLQLLSWSQLVYVISGLLQLLLVFSLLGIVDWLPRVWPSPTGTAGKAGPMSLPAGQGRRHAGGGEGVITMRPARTQDLDSWPSP